MPDGGADGARVRGASDAGSLEGRLVDGRYRVAEQIARGGMATVHRATDIRLDRVVALKVMHASLGDDPEFVMRFVREARAAARLSHPHVVAVHDQGQDAELGLVYLVMEHLPGRTLRDVVLEEAPLPPARALALLEPVLSALAAAHRAGIVHRDVKPENVLIGDAPDGSSVVKVADFGLAKAVSAENQHTATGGVLIGTVSYLAPELLTDGTCDARADVYAAGVVLHELLTGEKPHRGQSPIQIAYHHVHTDVPAPSERVPGIPAYVDALVARACVRDPGQRPADAAVLLHHLHRVAQALAAGVHDDPELTADLSPHPTPDPHDAVTPTAAGVLADDDSGTWLFDDGAAQSWPEQGTRDHEPPVALGRPPAPVPTGAQVDPRRQPGATRRRPGRGPLLLGLAVLLLALVAAGAYWLGVGRYTSVPGVVGQTQAQAVDRLEAAGLGVEVEEAFSETVAEGEVAGTDPSGGERVLDGAAVTLTMSLGPERFEVPAVRGEIEDAAQDAILEAGLEVGDPVERYNGNVEAGTALGSEPAAGELLRPGSEVSLVLSLGPRPVAVEDETGNDADDVEDRYEELGLVVARAETTSSEVAEGEVVSTDPGAGGELLPGQTLTLTVSTGPEEVQVPGGLVGSAVADVRARLEELGLVVVEDTEGSVGLGFVIEVDPSEGETVEVGSEVEITVI